MMDQVYTILDIINTPNDIEKSLYDHSLNCRIYRAHGLIFACIFNNESNPYRVFTLSTIKNPELRLFSLSNRCSFILFEENIRTKFNQYEYLCRIKLYNTKYRLLRPKRRITWNPKLILDLKPEPIKSIPTFRKKRLSEKKLS